MSRDMLVCINEAVDFANIHQLATLTFKDLLGLENISAVPQVHVALNPRYDQGILVAPGRTIDKENYVSIVFRPYKPPSTPGLLDHIKSLFLPPTPKARMLLEVRDQQDELLVSCVYGGLSDIVYIPARKPFAIIWSLCLSLATTKLSKGKLSVYDFWNTVFPENAEEFIETLKSISVDRKAASLDEMCETWLHAVENCQKPVR